MKLKEIKPNMAIHCKTDEEYEELCKHTERTCRGLGSVNELVYMINDRRGMTWAELKNINYLKCELVEFSDLIIPEEELSAVEVLETIAEMCRANNSCDCCAFGKNGKVGNCHEWCANHSKQVIEICRKWKADHEKKEPEVEMIDVCNVYKENKGKGFDFLASIKMPNNLYSKEDEVKRILGDYGKGHIAKIESMFRVKER